MLNDLLMMTLKQWREALSMQFLKARRVGVTARIDLLLGNVWVRTDIETFKDIEFVEKLVVAKGYDPYVILTVGPKLLGKIKGIKYD